MKIALIVPLMALALSGCVAVADITTTGPAGDVTRHHVVFRSAPLPQTDYSVPGPKVQTTLFVPLEVIYW